MNSVLEGIKVLDFTNAVAGPLIGVFLADFGAEVIKVESLDGDFTRSLYTTPFLGTESEMFMPSNRGKRGISIDATKDEGKKVLWRLIEKSDVLLENFRPGVMEKLGFGYEAVSRSNPRIIYASLSAWGKKGPLAGQPGYDKLVQALTGIMGAKRMPDGMPISTPSYFVDAASAMYTSYGIALALLYRGKTGEGQNIENTLLGMGVALQSADLVFVAKDTTKKKKTLNFYYDATWEPFRCKDGGYILGIVNTNKEFGRLCQALGTENLIDDPMFNDQIKRTDNARQLRAVLEKVYAMKTRDEWAKLLEKAGCAYAPVLDRTEVFDHPQLIESEAFAEIDHPKLGPVKMMGLPLKLSKTPAGLKRPPPQLGQHTKEVLQELGYTQAEIERLRQNQVIKCLPSQRD